MGKAFLPVALAIGLSGMADAAVINVPADYSTIQAAIEAAQPGNEVVVAPGTYEEAIDFLGKAITVRSSGGADVTTIDATGTGGTAVRAVTDEGPDTVLEGFTITGGTGDPDPYAGSEGGGMVIGHCDPTVTECIFTGNTADNGGGAHASGIFENGGLAFTNCTFGDNRAMWAGAALLNDGATDALVTNCNLWGELAWTIDNWEPAVTTVLYSNAQGGYPGTGNIDADPLFVDPANGDYRLQPDSPCIDAGHNWMVPVIVDMGAYEFQGDPFPVKRGDLDGDGVVGVTDFLELLAAWGPCGVGCCLADLDLDGTAGVSDFLMLLANWS